MTRILANYEYLAMTSDNLALVAHFLDRRTYLHFNFLSVNAVLYVHTQPQAMIGKDFRLVSNYYLLNISIANK